MTGSRAVKYRPLLLAILAVIVLPFALRALGLSLNTGTMVVALAVAAMGLNLCVGYTGLVSFGHGTWFGIGAYAAGLIQLHWFHGEIWLPLLLAVVVVAIASTLVGVVILRRRGVYFSLLTLALAALTYTTAFRWSEVTGGEDGLGGLKRGSFGPFNLDSALNYYVVVALFGLGMLYLLLRLVAFAVRPCADGNPRKPVARHLPGLSDRALQARGVCDFGRGDRVRRRAARLPELSGICGSGLCAVFRRTAGGRRDRRHAQHARAGAWRAVLCPVPGIALDLDAELAAVVWADLRRLRAVLAGRFDRHLGHIEQALVAAPEEAAAMSKRQNLPRPAAAGFPDAANTLGHRAAGRERLEEFWRHPRRHQRKPPHRAPAKSTL